MSTNKPKYRQSEHVVIARSQIQFAPYNPKNHTREQINEIKKNIKRVGFLGGVVWNEATGNLVDGHKRVMSLDLIHRYNGTPDTDYDIRVEKISLDEKTEKEQNIFQTQSRSELEVELMQSLISEIDYANAGLKLEDLNYYMPNIEVMATPQYNEEIRNDFDVLEEKTDQEREIEKEIKKQQVKEAKQETKNKMIDECEGDPFVTLSFSDFETKAYFMELMKANVHDKYIKGEDVLSGLKA